MNTLKKFWGLDILICLGFGNLNFDLSVEQNIWYTQKYYTAIYSVVKDL